MSTLKLHQLPSEILAVIIKNLPIGDVGNLILTCKELRKLIINDNTIWRSISRSRLIVHDHPKKRTLEQSWYDACRISYNWCKAKYKDRGLIYHDNNYMPWLKYHNSENLLLSVGSDLFCYPVDKYGFPNCKQYSWKLSMPKLKRYDKRTDDISRFVLKENLLVCGNRNGSTALYKVNDINSQPQRVQYIDNCLIDTDGEISAVEVINKRDNAYLITGSLDSQFVLFWNWDADNECPDLSRNSDDAGISFGMELGDATRETTKSLALNEDADKLAIGPDGNSKPVMVDITRVEFLIKSSESSNPNHIVQDVLWHDHNTLCYGTHAGALQMMDVRTHQVVYNTRDPFDAPIYCVKTDGNHAILTGTGVHSRCVLYDIRKTAHTQLYFTQKKWKMSPVYSVGFDSTKLIAATDRGVVALNFNVPASTLSKDYSDPFI